ncbi:MAG: hypothetical protein U0638_17260 [Phycisphaerales bacterium]
MQEGNNTSAVRLQTPEASPTTGTNPSPSTGNNPATDGTTLQVQTPAGKSTADLLKGMTAPDIAAGVALVVGIILVMRHFGWKKAGRAADDNLAHLEQARLLAQAARYQSASDAAGERRSSSSHSSESRANDDRLSRRMDEKIERLERLITEADRRIRRLEEFDSEARGPRMSIAPAGATATTPKLAAPRETPAETRGPQAAKSMGEPAKTESRLIEPRAQEATPDDWQSRTRQLAAAGLSAREIAFKLGKPIGHVELVLALQRGQIAG